MRFITERDLKDQYKKNPFTSFQLPEKCRLTPEARQFLLDRKIAIHDGTELIKKKEVVKAPESSQVQVMQEDYNDKTIFHVNLLQNDLYESALLTKDISFQYSQTLFRIGEALHELIVCNPDHPKYVDDIETVQKYRKEALEYERIRPIQLLGDHGAVILKLDRIRQELLLLSCNDALQTTSIYQFVKEINQIICCILGEK